MSVNQWLVNAGHRFLMSAGFWFFAFFSARPRWRLLGFKKKHGRSPLVIGGQTIKSASGLQQGDPLGPAAFALAVDPCASAVTAPLNVWYLDDRTIAGPADSRR